MSRLRFPKSFRWGASTRVTTEGASHEGGRGESIDDRFHQGATGEASHGYRRMAEDVSLLQRFGLTSYRFGIAWTRIQAEGRGPALAAGLDHYSALVDALLAAGIRPLPTLHQGDLPQALQDAGGWAARDTAGRFADFSSCIARRLADRVEAWLPFETPSLFLAEGLLEGHRSPGVRDRGAFLRAVHVVNLAQAMGAEALRAEGENLALGASIVGAPCEPASDEDADARATDLWRAFHEQVFLHPALGRGYPASFQTEDLRPAPELHAEEGDKTRCRCEIDFVVVSLAPATRVRASDDPRLGREAVVEPLPFDGDRWPEAVRQLLIELSTEPRHPPLEVVGLPCLDAPPPNPDGTLPDAKRIQQLSCDLEGIAQAIDQGADIRSYHAPHLLDAPTAAEAKPGGWGLLAIDPEDGARTPRASATWLGRVAEEGGLER